MRSVNEKQLGDGEDDASACAVCQPYRYIGEGDEPTPSAEDEGLINPCGEFKLIRILN